MSRILVVDDAQFLRARLSRLLMEYGHEVFEAENGAQAVRVYGAQKLDAVLMDVTMPEMDGLAALRSILETDPAARVVMLTALGQESIVLQAVRSGAKDFLVKPVEPERVLAAIHKALAA